MTKELWGYDVIKGIIPHQILGREKVDRYHVYEVYSDGSSKLLAVFYYKSHAKQFKKWLDDKRK